jgi:hypothetical protein
VAGVSEVQKVAELLGKGRNIEDIFKLSLFALFGFLAYLYYYSNLVVFKELLRELHLSLIYRSLYDFGMGGKLPEHLLTITIFIFLFSVIGPVVVFVYNCLRSRSYVWLPARGLRDWDFQGSVVVEEAVLKIKYSEVGAIIKSRSWKNCKMCFDFKIPEKISYGQPPNVSQLERGFGIIYRAKSLNQYFMLKVDASGYLPHVRNVEYWENGGPTITDKKLSETCLDKWIKAELVMKDGVLAVEIGGDKFKFYLPSYSFVSRSYVEAVAEKKSTEPKPFVPLSYLTSGTVGFRSAPLEEVHIKNLSVVPV